MTDKVDFATWIFHPRPLQLATSAGTVTIIRLKIHKTSHPTGMGFFFIIAALLAVATASESDGTERGM